MCKSGNRSDKACELNMVRNICLGAIEVAIEDALMDEWLHLTFVPHMSCRKIERDSS